MDLFLFHSWTFWFCMCLDPVEALFSLYQTTEINCEQKERHRDPIWWWIMPGDGTTWPQNGTPQSTT